MCHRYYVYSSADIIRYVAQAEKAILRSRMTKALARPMKTEGEVFPTDIVPVVALSRSGKETVFPMVWGFRNPRLKTPVFNARSETASTLPMFKESWKTRRCAIPCSWYFEWEHLRDSFSGKVSTGDRYSIQASGSSVMFLAGLYRFEDGFPYFTILTMDSVGSIRFIHDRMPVVLPASLVSSWISLSSDASSILSRALTDMVFEKVADSDTLRA